MESYTPTHATDYFFRMALTYEGEAVRKEQEAYKAFDRRKLTTRDRLYAEAKAFRRGAQECLDAAVDFEPKRFVAKR
mgnify:CR=1 FL=1